MLKISAREKYNQHQNHLQHFLPRGVEGVPSFPLGGYADAARWGAEQSFASEGSYYCQTDSLPKPPPELPLAAQLVAAPQGETSADAVTTNTVGSDAASSLSATPDHSEPEGTEKMDTAGAAAAPIIAPPYCHPWPSRRWRLKQRACARGRSLWSPTSR